MILKLFECFKILDSTVISSLKLLNSWINVIVLEILTNTILNFILIKTALSFI